MERRQHGTGQYRARAWFGEHERAGLRDFWAIYDADFDAALGETMDAVVAQRQEVREIGALLRAIPPEQLALRHRAMHELLRQAIDGDWIEYELELRVDAERYATAGVDIDGWSEIPRSLCRRVMPRLVSAYAAEPTRLTGALLAMQKLLDGTISVVTQACIETKSAALRRAEERFLRLCSSSVVGIIIGDFSGAITEANDTFLAMVGRTRDELDGGELRWAEPGDEEHGEVDRAIIDQLQRTGGAPSWERVFRRPDGSTLPVLLAVSMCESPSFLAVVLDLSERKNLERARVRHTELELESRRARDASRLKSEFLANMSHELRTPLNAIIGFTELIHDGEVHPEMPQFQEFLGDILTSARHLLQLINDVLDLSKVEAGKLEFQPELLDLEDVFSEVLAILRTTAATKHIRIESSIDPAVRNVEVDAARLKQVLYNFLSNALKFTHDRGNVALRASLAGDDAFRLEVTDDGIGISAEDLPRLFVEFQQLDGSPVQAQLGTGLGLALTKRLVVAQGGEVGVQSQLGQGSTFFAVLPRRARVGTPLPAPRVYNSARETAPRVLVIEDDARDQELLVRTLCDAGYSVETVASGAQALASCRARRFDAIVLDLLLPDTGGLQLLRRLRGEASHRTVPVVVVTVVTEQGVAAGFAVHDVLPKPLDGDALLRALARSGVAPGPSTGVLVVDDDESSRRLMNATLGQLGYVARCVADGELGLAAARSVPPAAVVLDLVMPGVDGFQFLERFRKLPGCQRVPVIVWTGKDLDARDHAQLRDAVHAVVAKGQGASAVLEELAHFLPRTRAPGGEV